MQQEGESKPILIHKKNNEKKNIYHMFLQYKLDCDDSGKDNKDGQEKSPESSLEQAGKVPELPRHINPLAAGLHELLNLPSPCLLQIFCFITFYR